MNLLFFSSEFAADPLFCKNRNASFLGFKRNYYSFWTVFPVPAVLTLLLAACPRSSRCTCLRWLVLLDTGIPGVEVLLWQSRAPFAAGSCCGAAEPVAVVRSRCVWDCSALSTALVHNVPADINTEQLQWIRSYLDLEILSSWMLAF